MIGQVVGGHRLIAKLGEGGMGVVYRAEDTMLGRTTAVKMLHPELSQNHEIVRRFFNEARAAAALKHLGIVEIYSFGYHDDGAAYIAMEHLDGESLHQRLAGRGKLPVSEAIRIARQIASALAAAHDADIVHRDLKPDNVYLVPDPDMPDGERIKLLDFGIAKLSNDGTQTMRTRTGAVMGTPSFMAPEQCRGAADIDLRADLYALGCMLFAMVCGQLPFTGELAGDIIAAQIRDKPPRPRDLDPSISADLEAVILRLLSKKPGDRYASAAAVRAALKAVDSATPTPAPMRAPTGDPLNSTLPGTGRISSKMAAQRGAALPKTEVTPRPPPKTTTPTPAPAPTPPPTPPPTDTTLGAAAGQAPTREPADDGGGGSRTWLWVALGVIAIGGGGAAIAMTAAGGGSSAPPAGDAGVIGAADAAAEPAPTSTNHWVRIDGADRPILLGVPSGEPASVSGFRPERLITAPRVAYDIQAYEVTWGELDPWLSENPKYLFDRPPTVLATPKMRANLPAVGMPQPVAAAYCASLGGSLPTEEQWEFAARGPEKRPWPWGSEPLKPGRVHVYAGPDARVQGGGASDDRTPGSEPIRDMLGNAREWTANVYRADLPGADERWTRAGGIKYAIRGLPLASSFPATIPTIGLAYRSALCGSGACLADTARLRATVGFRCVRPAR